MTFDQIGQTIDETIQEEAQYLAEILHKLGFLKLLARMGPLKVTEFSQFESRLEAVAEQIIAEELEDWPTLSLYWDVVEDNLDAYQYIFYALLGSPDPQGGSYLDYYLNEEIPPRHVRCKHS